jgi:hypothetical protein
LDHYVIKKDTDRDPLGAKIFSNNYEIAEIKKGPELSFILQNRAGDKWDLSSKVHGKIRPFSLSVHDVSRNESREVLTIKDHLFKHNDRFYMFMNHPEGRPLHEYLQSHRYICRLVNFPYADLADIEHHGKHRLRRYRGVPVGELSGLGIHGHNVKVSKELHDIGLLVAASSYLLYSAA